MNTKQRTISILFLIVSLIISGCGPGQFLAPTITPSPSNTPTITPTSTPTITPTFTPTLTPTATVDFAATATQQSIELENKALAFCNEKKNIPESADYDPGAVLSPLLVCDGYHCLPMTGLLAEPIGLDLAQWTPGSAQDIQLILCQDKAKQRTVFDNGYCNYYAAGKGSFSVPAYTVVDHYSLYAAKTGKNIKNFWVPGKDRVYCPTTVSINEKQIKGDSDMAGLFKQLSTYLKMSIPSPTPPVYTLQCNIRLDLDTGHLQGVSGFTILGESMDPSNKFTGNDTQTSETLSGKTVKVVMTVDRKAQYAKTGHTYYFKGTITVSVTDPKLSYDITATGSAFTTSPQVCKMP